MENENENAVEPHVANLLAILSDERWLEPRCPKRVLSQVRLGSRQIAFESAILEFDSPDVDTDASVSMRLRVPLEVGRQFDLREWTTNDFEVATADDWRLSAKSAISRGAQTSAGPDRSVVINLTLELRDWILTGPRRPLAWVAELYGEFGHSFGNLRIDRAGGGGSWGHLRLRGSRYTYYLVSPTAKFRDRGSRFLVLTTDNASEAPEPYIVNREMPLLDFVLGASFGTSRFYALDDKLIFSGAMRGSFVHPSKGSSTEYVVPAESGEKRVWAVPFFRKLCEYRPDRPRDRLFLMLAIWYFRATTEETSRDVSTAALALAVVASARALDESLDRAQDTQLDGLALVKARMAEIQLPILDELAGAFDVFQQSLRALPLASPTPYSALAQLRAIAVAFLAKAVGYHGALAGWDWDPDWYHPQDLPEGWWATEEGDEKEALDRFVATEGAHDGKPEWPRIQLPSVPATGPIRIVADFAAQLASRTEGLVEAVVRPNVPSDGRLSYDFCLEAGPALSSVIFTMEERGGAVSVTGFGDDEVVVQEEHLTAFLKTVSADDSVQRRVLQLAIARTRIGARNDR